MAVTPALISPLSADQYRAQGNALLRQGQVPQAAMAYAQAAQLAPRDVAARVNLGYALLELGRAEEAAWVSRCAAALDPGSLDAHFLLAQALGAQGQHLGALRSLRRALVIDPAFGFAKQAMEASQQHIAQQEAALARSAAGPVVARILGLLALERWHEALALCADESVERQLLAAQALLGLGQAALAQAHVISALRQSGDHPHCLALAVRCAIALGDDATAVGHASAWYARDPASGEASLAMGLALFSAGRGCEAVAIVPMAQLTDVQLARNLNLHATGLITLMDLAQAQEVVQRGLALVPEDPDLHWNQAVLCALRGDWLKAWESFEYRFDCTQLRITTPAVRSRPQLTPAVPTQGKVIFVFAEQGLGDSIQFLRYVALLSGKGARVLLQIPPSLHALVRDMACAHQWALLAPSDPVPAFDYQTALMSLPWVFGIDPQVALPSEPYLQVSEADRTKWLSRLTASVGRLRVGLVWSGNSEHRNDKNRSLALAQLLSHMPPSVQLVSLQKEVRTSDWAALKSAPQVLHFGDELHNFSDTAALASCMDVVVSVDTSVAHLVGALGKPLWLLVTYMPDWRWRANTVDTPWYPSAKLIRQSQPKGWDADLATLGKELAAYAERWQG